MTTELELDTVGNVFYFVDRLDEAVEWYAARLDREPVQRGSVLVAFEIGSTRLTLHEVDSFNTGGPGGVAVYWTVPDVDAVAADWTQYGATVHRGPKTVFTGERLCQLLDPFGNLFCIRQLTS